MVRVSTTATVLLALASTVSAERWTTIFKTTWSTAYAAPTLELNVNKNMATFTASHTNVGPTSTTITSSSITASTFGERRGYTLYKNYDSTNFFSNFDFFTENDPTGGYVDYLDYDSATQRKLTECKDGSCRIGVDDTTDLPQGVNRSSVRIESKDSFGGGLFVLDVNHVPTGCSTWPAFWLVGPSWPDGGEIDMFEAIHTQPNNQFIMHSNDCVVPDTRSEMSTGQRFSNTDCADNGKGGCKVESTRPAAGFKGQIVTQWNHDFVKIWMFSENEAPADLFTDAPNPSSWYMKPDALFSAASTCNIAERFKDMKIVINTSLCGNWAGSTAAGTACTDTCANYVMRGDNFKEAYWDIKSLKVYNQV